MKFRKLRIAWSVFWGLAGVLLLVLWVRSYAQHDSYNWSRTHTTSDDLLMFGAGRIALLHNCDRPENDGFNHYSQVFKGSGDMRSWFRSSMPICGPDQMPIHYPAGFGMSRTLPQDFVVTLPFWFAVLLFAGFAVAPWLPWRFSLRTLLIATTLVAVMLGLIVWSVHR